MKNLKRIRYDTMNSWNNSQAPAYNLKVYNVIDSDLQDKVYELMEAEDFYAEINQLISDFDYEHDHLWQAGFNGRSGGYLVLYKGGKHTKFIGEDLFTDEYNNRAYISDRHGWLSKKECEDRGILNKTITTKVYSQAGLNIEDSEVPAQVLRDFRKLAVSIVKTVEWQAKNYTLEDQRVYSTVKVLKEV